MPAANDGGLGEHIVGDKVLVGKRNLQIVDLLGEGEFLGQSDILYAFDTKVRSSLSPLTLLVQVVFRMLTSWIQKMPTKSKSNNWF
jgi:hypothetical protein